MTLLSVSRLRECFLTPFDLSSFQNNSCFLPLCWIFLWFLLQSLFGGHVPCHPSVLFGFLGGAVNCSSMSQWKIWAVDLRWINLGHLSRVRYIHGAASRCSTWVGRHLINCEKTHFLLLPNQFIDFIVKRCRTSWCFSAGTSNPSVAPVFPWHLLLLWSAGGRKLLLLNLHGYFWIVLYEFTKVWHDVKSMSGLVELV